MLRRKTDEKFIKRHFWNMVIWGVPFSFACGVGFFAYGLESINLFVGACAVGSTLAVLGLIQQKRLVLNYRCPECGKILPHSRDKETNALLFQCSACCVLWDTKPSEED